MVPVESDVPDASGGDKPQDSFNHSEASAQDRNQGQLLAADVLSNGGLERRLNIHWLDCQIDGCLISHQHRDLVDELLEDLRRGFVIAQYRQLVLNERMPDNCQRWKFSDLFNHFSGFTHSQSRWNYCLKIRMPAETYLRFPSA